MSTSILFQPCRIGRLTIRNRLVRASTSETMSQPDGSITEDYVRLYRNLALGGAGLILSGHMFVHARGRYQRAQAGIHDDGLVPALRRFTKEIHDAGGVIFAELGHAGSQCRVPSITPIAPSRVGNFISGREPEEASVAEIEEAIQAFGAGARRAREAGYDGVHIHAGHGYLISQFSSPYGNRRNDEWGGDAERRGRFLMAVYRSVRTAVGPDFPVTIKLGMADSMPGGLEIEESVPRGVALEAAGVDALEASVGIMHVSTNKSIGRFVAVSPKRAMEDWVVHRLLYPASEQAYFLASARALKPRLQRIPLLLVGGIRSTEMMEKLIRDGDVDLISMARPFIREPDLPKQIEAGRRGVVDCVSCNICSDHEGFDPVQCWRLETRKLLSHIGFRIRRKIGLPA